MPPTTLAIDTREEDEEDPEVVEEEKDESKDGVPFFTGEAVQVAGDGGMGEEEVVEVGVLLEWRYISSSTLP